jgi:hypothetical protein
MIIEILALTLVIALPDDRMRVLGINMTWPLLLGCALLGALTFLSIRNSTAPHSSGSIWSQWIGKPYLKWPAILACVVMWGLCGRSVGALSTLNPTQNQRKLLTYLQTLPKDVLIAGTPCALDNVPLFAKRQILFSCEHPIDDETLTLTALKAYYAREKEEVLSFCRAYQVDYLVVDSRYYQYANPTWVFYEPYNEKVLRAIRGRETFALSTIPNAERAFQSEHYYVIKCDRTM